IGARLAALEARTADEESRPIAQAVRRHGGRRVDAGLVVEPGVRAAVETALGEVARASQVERTAVAELGGARGTLVVAPSTAPAGGRSNRDGDGRAVASATALGGGRLSDAVRQDPLGAASRWLA